MYTINFNSIGIFCRVCPPVPVPGAARPQVLQPPDIRDYMAERPMDTQLFGRQGRCGLRGHRKVRSQLAQPAVEEGIQRNQSEWTFCCHFTFFTNMIKCPKYQHLCCHLTSFLTENPFAAIWWVLQAPSGGQSQRS